MLDPEFLKLLFQQSTGVILAVIVLYWQRADHKKRETELLKERDGERERADRLTTALEQNTRVLTETVETMRALRGEVESCPLRQMAETAAMEVSIKPSSRRNNKKES